MTVAAWGCGGGNDGESFFSFDENFEFEEPGPNGEPNGAPGNFLPNSTTGNNGTLPEACPVRLLDETIPDGPAEVTSTASGALATMLVGGEVRLFERRNGSWSARELRDRPIDDAARSVDIAGSLDSDDDWFWLTTSADDRTLLWACEDTCSQRAKFDFDGPAQLYSNTRFSAYVAGLTTDRAVPRFEIRFFANGRTGLASYAEAPSVPSQYGYAPISIPDNPQLRTEFRAAWDTGQGPLAFFSVNTGLLMEPEPECNRLDLLGGRVVPLSSSQGIVVSSSGDAGPVLTWEACDGVSAPTFYEASRGLTDFDVAYSEADLQTSDLYWLDEGSLWGATINGETGELFGPVRRVATVPNGSFVRAAFSASGNVIVVTTESGVVGIVDNPMCAEPQGMPG